MSTKCIACRKRNSTSVDEPGIPPLCNECWGRTGDRDVRVGAKVVCTAHVEYNGTIRCMDDSDFIAIVKTDDGGEAWIPVAELVAVK